MWNGETKFLTNCNIAPLADLNRNFRFGPPVSASYASSAAGHNERATRAGPSVFPAGWPHGTIDSRSSFYWELREKFLAEERLGNSLLGLRFHLCPALLGSF